MGSEQNYIDKLYSDKFGGFEMQSSAEDWAALSTKLGKANFLKFSFATFNAYYLTVIIVLTITAIFFVATNLNLNNKIEDLENQIEELNQPEIINLEQAPIIDSNLVEPDVKEVATIDKNALKREIKKNQQEDVNVSENQELKPERNKSSIEKDTTSVIKPIVVEKSDSIAAKAPTKKIKRIKKTVFVKKEPVIVNDTVTINKK